VTSGEKTADRLRPERCLECKGVINAHSTYTFFCCRECASSMQPEISTAPHHSVGLTMAVQSLSSRPEGRT
jgi:predicted metal-binding protein